MRADNYIIRMSVEERERWDAACRAAGAKNLAEFIRAAVEARISDPEGIALRRRIERARAALDGAFD